MIIKVCGLREANNLKQVESLGVDWIGFIFYSHSPRNITIPPSYMPQRAQRVGVFVNEQLPQIIQKVSEFGLDIIQLHGNENLEFCMELRNRLPHNVEIMKAVQIEKEGDTERAQCYGEYINYVLFETKCNTYGGSGKQFNWQWLQNYKGPHPFILSGGIGPKDAQTIKSLKHPFFWGIDLNSCFEESPGIKDIQLLDKFLHELRE